MSFFIGTLKVEKPYIAGPMAELSHIALRQQITRFGGAGLLFTEMLDAGRVPREVKEHNPWLEKPEGAPPQIFQLVVSEEEKAVKAVQFLEDFGAEGIDLNMGCAAPNIRKMKGGVSLMKETDKAKSLVASVRRKYKGPLTSKIRTGFEKDISKTIAFAKALESEGIDALIFHPRLHNQKFKALADWSGVGEVKKALSIPVIGNGDINSAEEARNRLHQSGADGVMISRLSAVKPWIFREIERLEQGVSEKFKWNPEEIWMEFFTSVISYFDEKDALKRMVKWTEYYARNFTYGHHFWVKVKNSETLEKAKEEACRFFESLKKA